MDALSAWKACLAFHSYWLLPLHMTLCRQYKSVCKKPWFFIHVQTDSKDIHTQEERIISQGKVEGSKNLTDKELIVFYLVSIIYMQQHTDDTMLC